MNSTQTLIAVVIMSVITIAIRFAPFVVLRGKATPKVVAYLGQCLPYAVMGMLVVYCYKDMNFVSSAGYIPSLIAGIIVGISYIIGRNTLASIIIGTICYMLFVQVIFI